MTEKNFHLRIKIWLEDEKGAIVFGRGRMRLLEMIESTGSLLRAAEEMKMSYRSAWGRLKSTEQLLGHPVIEQLPGQGRRGGSRLTPLGKGLLDKYRRLSEELERAGRQVFDEVSLVED